MFKTLMNPTDVSQLGQYGLVGVMLALILLTASALWILYKIVTHNTDAQVETAKALERLTTFLEAKL